MMAADTKEPTANASVSLGKAALLTLSVHLKTQMDRFYGATMFSPS